MAAPLGMLELSAGKSRVVIRYRHDPEQRKQDLERGLRLLQQAVEVVRITMNSTEEEDEQQ